MINIELKKLIKKAYKAGRRNALKQDEANLNDFINKHESKLKLFSIPNVNDTICDCIYEHVHTNWYKCKKCGHVTAI